MMNAGSLTGNNINPPGPTAAFSLNPATIKQGFTSQFKDLSTGAPTSWAWYANGLLLSNVQNPIWYGAAPGTFIITLTASNAFGSNTSNPQTLTVTQ
jgi:PKD repeat protein